MGRLFVFYLLFLPFIVWRGNYEGPKVVYFFAGSLSLFIFWIIRILKYKKYFEFRTSDYLYILWLVILTAASLTGIHPFDSIIGGSYRHQGILFFLSLWVTAKTIQILSVKNKKLLAGGVGVAVLAESVIILAQFIGSKLYFGTPLGTIGETNALAGFLAFGTFFLAKGNVFYLTMALAAVLLTHSKIGLFAFAVTGFSRFLGNVNKKTASLIIGIVVMLAFVAGFGILRNDLKYLFAPVTSLWHLESEDRILIWRMSLNKIAERPVLGWGAESSEKVIGDSYSDSDMGLEGIIVDRSHNLGLDVLLWSGFLGLILFAGWWYLVFRETIGIEKKLALVSFLVYASFQPLSIVHWILLMITINI